MSRWSDYGYPDLAGVPIQTALEGLWLALDERVYAVDGTHIQELPAVVNHLQPIWEIESLVRGGMTGLLLPDGTPWSAQAAADYLGEDLITVPTGGRTYTWNNPYPPISRDWMLQRYRMLNVAYLVAPSNLQTRNIYGAGAGGNDYDDPTYTLAEAWDQADARYTDETRETAGSLVFYCILLAHTGDILGRTTYVGIRDAAAPVSLSYFSHIPGDIFVTFTAGTFSGYPVYDDFGTGIANGETVMKTIQTPQDVAFGDTVNFPSWWSDAYNRFSVARTQTVGRTSFYARVPYAEEPFRFGYSADVRRGLEFYDDVDTNI